MGKVEYGDVLMSEGTTGFGVSLLFLLFMAIAVFWELVLGFLSWLSHRFGGSGLASKLWLSKLKEELLSLGVISLLLEYIKPWLLTVCTSNTIQTASEDSTKAGRHLLAPDWQGAMRVLLAAAPTDKASSQDFQCPPGKQALFSKYLIIAAHYLLFWLAVMQIVYTVISTVFTMLRFCSFNRWEQAARVAQSEPGEALKLLPQLVKMGRKSVKGPPPDGPRSGPAAAPPPAPDAPAPPNPCPPPTSDAERSPLAPQQQGGEGGQSWCNKLVRGAKAGWQATLGCLDIPVFDSLRGVLLMRCAAHGVHEMAHVNLVNTADQALHHQLAKVLSHVWAQTLLLALLLLYPARGYQLVWVTFISPLLLALLSYKMGRALRSLPGILTMYQEQHGLPIRRDLTTAAAVMAAQPWGNKAVLAASQAAAAGRHVVLQLSDLQSARAGEGTPGAPGSPYPAAPGPSPSPSPSTPTPSRHAPHYPAVLPATHQLSAFCPAPSLHPAADFLRLPSWRQAPSAHVSIMGSRLAPQESVWAPVLPSPRQLGHQQGGPLAPAVTGSWHPSAQQLDVVMDLEADLLALFWFRRPKLLLWVVAMVATLNGLSLMVSCYFLVVKGPVRGFQAVAIWLPLLLIDLASACYLGYVTLPQYGLLVTALVADPEDLFDILQSAALADALAEEHEGITGKVIHLLSHLQPGKQAAQRHHEEKRRMARKKNDQRSNAIAKQFGLTSDPLNDAYETRAGASPAGPADDMPASYDAGPAANGTATTGHATLPYTENTMKAADDCAEVFVELLALRAGVIWASRPPSVEAFRHKLDRFVPLVRLLLRVWALKAQAEEAKAQGAHHVDDREMTTALAQLRVNPELQALRSAFNVLDPKHADKITATQLGHHVRHVLGSGVSPGELKTMLSEVDVDGSKSISFSEMVLYLCFCAIDPKVGGSGRITLDSLATACENLGCDTLSSVRTLKAMIRMADPDKLRVVGLRRFVHALSFIDLDSVPLAP